MNNKIVLGQNQYGKAEVRVVKITRDTDRHEIEDLNVTSQLRGDFAAAHLEGDNSHVVATDTQKNTIYAFARDGIGSPEAFLLRLGRPLHLELRLGHRRPLGGRAYSWDRIQAHGAGTTTPSCATARKIRTAVLVRDGADRHLISGLKDLTVLKSTQSGFDGFPRDKYTTLPETTDRILATDVSARWRYNTGTDFGTLDFNKSYDDVKAPPAGGLHRKVLRTPCSRPCSIWAPRSWRRTPRSTRSSSPCPTSTTSWSTSPRLAWTTPTRSSLPPTARTA